VLISFSERTNLILQRLRRNPSYTQYINGTHFLISDEVIVKVQKVVFDAAPGKIEFFKTFVEDVNARLRAIATAIPKGGLGFHFP
jgi:hypothetical protein